MKTIHLQNSNYEWRAFEYETMDELLKEIGSDAEIGNGAKIGNYAKIGSDAEIGNGAEIGNYAEIGNGAKIGNYAKIGSDAKIGNDAEIGNYAEILKGIYIHGSKHAVTYTGNKTISIGCQNHTFEYWLANFEIIGKKSSYLEDEILEYKSYIEMIIKLKS